MLADLRSQYDHGMSMVMQSSKPTADIDLRTGTVSGSMRSMSTMSDEGDAVARGSAVDALKASDRMLRLRFASAEESAFVFMCGFRVWGHHMACYASRPLCIHCDTAT